MIKVNIVLKDKDSTGRVLASGYIREFESVEDLIIYCNMHTTYNYFCDYEVIKEGGDE